MGFAFLQTGKFEQKKSRTELQKTGSLIGESLPVAVPRVAEMSQSWMT